MILNSCDKEDQHCIMYEQCNKEFLSHVFAYWKFHEHEPMVITSMLITDVLIMYCMIWENESDVWVQLYKHVLDHYYPILCPTR